MSGDISVSHLKRIKANYHKERVPYVERKVGDFWYDRVHGRITGMFVQLPIPDLRRLSFYTWEWDGNKKEPTLEGSIKCYGTVGDDDCAVIWHGYLRDGWFERI